MFEIGDEVEIITNSDGHCPYSWTTPGSRGVVTKVFAEYSEVQVSWSFFANPDCTDPIGYHYTVGTCYLKKLTSIKLTNPADLKYSKIIMKMKRMEAKRKELGYKTYESI